MIHRSNSTAIIAGCGLLLCLVPLTARAAVLPTQVISPAGTSPESVLATPLRDASSIRSFISPNSDYSAGHRGVDYPVAIDAELIAPTSGRMYFNGPVAERNVLTIKRSNGDLVTLEPACSGLGVGSVVAIGKILGKFCPGKGGYRDHCAQLLNQPGARAGMGSTLRCLHFSYRTDGGYLSPDAVMGLLSPTRLAKWSDV